MKCYHCEKTGHLARCCPEKKKTKPKKTYPKKNDAANAANGSEDTNKETVEGNVNVEEDTHWTCGVSDNFIDSSEINDNQWYTMYSLVSILSAGTAIIGSTNPKHYDRGRWVPGFRHKKPLKKFQCEIFTTGYTKLGKACPKFKLRKALLS